VANEVLIVQRTVWDSENDAKEFFDAYVKRTLRRYPDAKVSELLAAGAEKLPQQGGPKLQSERQAWETSEGGVVVELRGSQVLILEGIPEKVGLASMIRLLWQ
jgi:hypothetical protein